MSKQQKIYRRGCRHKIEIFNLTLPIFFLCVMFLPSFLPPLIHSFPSSFFPSFRSFFLSLHLRSSFPPASILETSFFLGILSPILSFFRCPPKGLRFTLIKRCFPGGHNIFLFCTHSDIQEYDNTPNTKNKTKPTIYHLNVAIKRLMRSTLVMRRYATVKNL